MKTVGVLSLQGDFAAHGAAVERAGGKCVFVRQREQLAEIDGLIIPGGESTTMLKLLNYEGLMGPLADFGRQSRCSAPVPEPFSWPAASPTRTQESLGLVDITVERNAYGRQIDSRVTEIEPGPEFEKRAGPGKLEAVFIRAPIIRGHG